MIIIGKILVIVTIIAPLLINSLIGTLNNLINTITGKQFTGTSILSTITNNNLILNISFSIWLLLKSIACIFILISLILTHSL